MFSDADHAVDWDAVTPNRQSPLDGVEDGKVVLGGHGTGQISWRKLVDVHRGQCQRRPGAAILFPPLQDLPNEHVRMQSLLVRRNHRRNGLGPLDFRIRAVHPGAMNNRAAIE